MKTALRDRNAMSAFTLIELMVVVAIIGVLASVAVPSVMRYIRKAKTAEATHNLRFIVEGSRTYIAQDWSAPGSGETLEHQFPESEAVTPLAPCCLGSGGRCDGSLSGVLFGSSQTWNALHFGVQDSHHYRYEYVSSGSSAPGAGSWYTARALGDLDCDGVIATFEMYGEYRTLGDDASASGGIFSKNEVE